MTRSSGRLLDAVRTGFWAVPTTCVVLAIGLALAMVEVDRSLGARLGGLMSAAGLGSCGPSCVTARRSGRRSGCSWPRSCTPSCAHGRQHRRVAVRPQPGDDGRSRAPARERRRLHRLIHHVATSIQVSPLIRAVDDETRAAIERQLPPQDAPVVAARPAFGDPSRTVSSRRYGVVMSVDVQTLVKLGRRADVVLVLRPAPGEATSAEPSARPRIGGWACLPRSSAGFRDCQAGRVRATPTPL